jgi:hypothetical protein
VFNWLGAGHSRHQHHGTPMLCCEQLLYKRHPSINSLLALLGGMCCNPIAGTTTTPCSKRGEKMTFHRHPLAHVSTLQATQAVAPGIAHQSITLLVVKPTVDEGCYRH